MLRQQISLQKVFDLAAGQMHRHGFCGERSSESSHFYAAYRDGEKACPVGVFLPKNYDKALDGVPFTDREVQDAMTIAVTKPIAKLLRELQRLHDQVLPVEWNGRLRSLARRFKLHTAVLDGRRGRPS